MAATCSSLTVSVTNDRCTADNMDNIGHDLDLELICKLTTDGSTKGPSCLDCLFIISKIANYDTITISHNLDTSLDLGICV